MPPRARDEDQMIEISRERYRESVRWRNDSGRRNLARAPPLGQRLPEFKLVPIRVIDPGKATVGFVHSFGVDFYSLLF